MASLLAVKIAFLLLLCLRRWDGGEQGEDEDGWEGKRERVSLAVDGAGGHG